MNIALGIQIILAGLFVYFVVMSVFKYASKQQTKHYRPTKHTKTQTTLPPINNNR